MMYLLAPVVFPFFTAIAQEPLVLDAGPTLPQPTKAVWAAHNPGAGDFIEPLGRDGRFWWVISPTWLEAEASYDSYFNDNLSAAQKSIESVVEIMAPNAGWAPADQGAFLQKHAVRTVPVDFRLQNSAGLDLFAGELRPAPLQSAEASTGAWRNMICSFSVQIAQGASISHPQIAYQRNGVSVSIALKPVPGTGWLAEIIWTGGEPLSMGDIQTGDANTVSKPRIASQVHEMQTWALLEPQKTTSCRLNNFTLFLTPSAAAPPPLAVQDDKVAVCVPTLIGTSEWAALFGMDGPMPWSADGGWVAFLEGEARAQAQSLVASANQKAQCKNALVRVLRVDAGQETEIFHWAGPIHPGHATRFAEGSSFDALTAWDVEVASGSRIPEPIFTNQFSGVTGSVSTRQEYGQWGLDIDLLLQESQLAGTRSVHFAAEQGRHSGHDGDAAPLPEQKGLLENVVIQGSSFTGFYALENGSASRHELKSANSHLNLELSLDAD